MGIGDRPCDHISPAPGLFNFQFDVCYLHLHAGLTPDAYGFLDGPLDILALIPQMSCVNTPIRLDLLGQFDDLLCLRESAGDVLESRAQPDGARLHLPADKGFHSIKFLVCGAAVLVAHDLTADGVVPDECGEVDRHAIGFEFTEQVFQRKAGAAAIPADHRSHSLKQVIFGVGV